MIEKIKLYAKVVWYRLRGWRIVYKVCYVSEEGNFGSAYPFKHGRNTLTEQFEKYRVAYQIGFISAAPESIPDSKLFCFSSKDSATFFLHSIWGSVILLICIAKVDKITSLKMCAPHGHIKEYNMFWDTGKGHTWTPPKGTVFCGEVLPIRKISP